MIISGWPYSTGWPSPTRTWITVPERGAGIWFIVFIASMMSSGSPGFTWPPTSTKGRAPRAGRLRRVDFRRGRGGRDAPWRLCRPQPRTCRTKICRTEMARNTYRHAVALELDLGEPGFVEELRQIANDVVVDRWRLRHGRGPGLARHDQSLAPILAPIMFATAAMASA